MSGLEQSLALPRIVTAVGRDLTAKRSDEVYSSDFHSSPVWPKAPFKTKGCPDEGLTTSIYPGGSSSAAAAPAPAQALPPPPQPRPKSPLSSLAVASFVQSFLSLILGPFGFVPGIICGHLAKSRLRRDGWLRGAGFARAGLIIGYLGLTLTGSPEKSNFTSLTVLDPKRRTGG